MSYDDEEDYDEAPKPKKKAAAKEPVDAGESQSPLNTLSITGYNAIEAQLVGAFNEGKLPHGLIFAGEGGRGKETMAFRLARALLSTRKARPFTDLSVADDDPIINRLISGAHPDFQAVRRRNKKDKAELSNDIIIDSVREASHFLGFKPVESDWRVVIVDEAHLMNTEAQNAFLKTLEEPPPQTLLILIAHQPSRLLATIRSRAQVVNFPALPATTLMNEAGSALMALPRETQDIVIRLARGGVGAMKRLLDPALVTGIERIRVILQPNTPTADVYALAESWATSQLGGTEPMLLLEEVVMDHLNHKLRNGLDVAETKDNTLEAIEAAQDLFTTARHKYLDKRQVIRQAFAILREAG